MSESQMPAAEAIHTSEPELQSYEFAFHILPTVAEGEVAAVFANLKALITKVGGQVISEEVPERFDLAYEISKYLEGKNRKFSSAYFGWVRFELVGSKLAPLTEELEGVKELLRYLMIKLTKVEEENTFRFHESIERKKVHTVNDEEVVSEEVGVVEEVAALAEVVTTVAPDDSAEKSAAV